MTTKTAEQIEKEVRGIERSDYAWIEDAVVVYHNPDTSWSVADNGEEDMVATMEEAVALTISVVMENRAKLAEKEAQS